MPEPTPVTCPRCGSGNTQRDAFDLPSFHKICRDCGATWDETNVAALRRRLAEMRETLSRYGRHESDCEQTLSSEIIVPCSCGFDALFPSLEQRT